MANTYKSGSIHVDSTGLLVTGKVKVSYILLTSGSTHAESVLRDGTTSGAPIKFNLKNGTNNDTKLYDFSRKPLIFNDGIYCSTLATGAEIMLVITTAGSNE